MSEEPREKKSKIAVDAAGYIVIIVRNEEGQFTGYYVADISDLTPEELKVALSIERTGIWEDDERNNFLYEHNMFVQHATVTDDTKFKLIESLGNVDLLHVAHLMHMTLFERRLEIEPSAQVTMLLWHETGRIVGTRHMEALV